MAIGYYTLCFPDYLAARAAAQALGFWSEPSEAFPEGQLVSNGSLQDANRETRGWAIDEIGVLYTDPVLDEQGAVIESPQELPGYWVNVAGQLPAGGEAMLGDYIRPYGLGGRVFCGTEPAT